MEKRVAEDTVVSTKRLYSYSIVQTCLVFHVAQDKEFCEQQQYSLRVFEDEYMRNRGLVGRQRRSLLCAAWVFERGETESQFLSRTVETCLNHLVYRFFHSISDNARHTREPRESFYLRGAKMVIETTRSGRTGKTSSARL